MKSKYFKNKLSKLLLITLLTGTALITANENDVAASVAQDLVVYSGGGGGGPVMGYSYGSGYVGVNGSGAVYYGDEAYIIRSGNNSNILRGSVSENTSVLNVPGFMPGDQYGFGGGVDSYTGNTSPQAANSYFTYDIVAALSNFSTNSVLNVADARFVAGNGGQAADQDFMYQLVNKYINQQTTLDYSFDRYILPLNGILQQAGQGSPLGVNISHQFNLEGSMYIKSGALGDDVPFTERTLINPFNPNQVVVTQKTPRAIGGIVNLYFSSLNVTNNNDIRIVRDSAYVNVVVNSLEMNSNANVTLESMDAQGDTSSFNINSTNFNGGTLIIDQTSNSPVNISGNRLNVMGRNFDGDLVYDLITSPDSLTGNIQLVNNANKLVEYRLITSSGTIVIPNTQTTLDLGQYSGVKTIQAVFGYEAMFESNGGTLVPTQTEINLNELVVKPNDPVKSGFDFEGWYVDSALSSLYNFSTPVTANVTLYAKWKPALINHNFNFESNGGPQVPSQIVEHGKTAAEVSDPTLTNHYFEGWYTDNTFNTLYDFSNPVITDTTVYAKWSPNIPENTIIHTFIFESNGGSPVTSQFIKDKDLAFEPLEPGRENYNFLGWFTDNTYVELYDFSKPVIKDTIVYAKWGKKVVVEKNDNPSKPTVLKPTINDAPEHSENKLPQTGHQGSQLKGLTFVGLGILSVLIAKKKNKKDMY